MIATTEGPVPPILKLVEVRKAFDGIQAVDGANLSVESGTITALIGANGAGKSTLVNLITGIERCDQGAVYYNGLDISRRPTHLIARDGLIRTFQTTSEFARLSVMDNLLASAPGQRGATLWGATRGRRYWREQEQELRSRAAVIVERFGLTVVAKNYAGELSGGQKRLLELARAVMAKPKLLLLDEPLAGVNPGIGKTVESHLMSMRAEGITMLMVEHELGVVERCSDTVIMMSEGRVLAEGSMHELRQRQEVIDAYLMA